MTEGGPRQEIVDLLVQMIGVTAQEVLPDTDIEKDLGCTGDDFYELMDAYSKRFNVDMSGYLWYFHTGEEGWSFSLIHPRPNDLVERIPITPTMLAEFATNGKWEVTYPPHELPSYRLDRIIERVLFLVILGWIAFKLAW